MLKELPNHFKTFLSYPFFRTLVPADFLYLLPRCSGGARTDDPETFMSVNTEDGQRSTSSTSRQLTSMSFITIYIFIDNN